MCGGSERTGCLACSRDKDVAHSLPDGRGRKEGGGGGRENMFPWLRKEGCRQGRGTQPWGKHLKLSWFHRPSSSPAPMP